MILNDRPRFYDRARCRTGNGEMVKIFFPDQPQASGAYLLARTICGGCPVLDECREHAIEHETGASGMFGGLTPDQRSRERVRRKREAAA